MSAVMAATKRLFSMPKNCGKSRAAGEEGGCGGFLFPAHAKLLFPLFSPFGFSPRFLFLLRSECRHKRGTRITTSRTVYISFCLKFFLHCSYGVWSALCMSHPVRKLHASTNYGTIDWQVSLRDARIFRSHGLRPMCSSHAAKRKETPSGRMPSVI